MFRILAEELLGYDISILTLPGNHTMPDREEIFQHLASCTTALCDGYNSRPDGNSAPPAMLTLDLWLPPSYHVDTWGLVDAGQLGPAVRFGWFIPSRTEAKIPPNMDHWKILSDTDTARAFHPSQEQMAVIEPFLRTPDNRLDSCTTSYITIHHYTDITALMTTVERESSHHQPAPHSKTTVLYYSQTIQV